VSTELPSGLRKVAGYQSGVFSRKQALQAGLSEATVKYRARSGNWQKIHPGVYAVFTGPPDRGAWLWAAVLSAGPGAVLSHETAAELQRLIDKPAPLVHVTVPATRRVAPIPGVTIHLLARVADVRFPDDALPRTWIEDTVLDLTQTAETVDDACGWITRAFGRRLTNELKLRATMGLRKRLRWRNELDDYITAAAGGAHSPLEFRYDRDVERAHGLPRSQHQVPFTKADGGRGFRDRFYEKYGVVVELDGNEAHAAEDRWIDRARDNAAAAEGKQSLRYGWKQVRWEACDTAAEIAKVLRLHGWDGTPRACSPTCVIARP
jgi:Transcriptional regulator, AbiEi antitoxin